MKRHSLFFCLLAALLSAMLITAGGCRSITTTAPEFTLPTAALILTFDDGPNAHEDTTARLLDILQKHRVPAIFCLLGENVERSPALVRRIRDEGHVIVNHGYSDKWAGGMGGAEFRENLERGAAAIEAALGEPLAPKLYRPQGGFYRKRQEQIWRDAGWTLVPGGLRAFDAVLSAKDRRKVVSRIVNKAEARGGGIILLHDARDSHFRMETELAAHPAGPFNRSWIPETVEELILALRARGYQFEIPPVLTR